MLIFILLCIWIIWLCCFIMLKKHTQQDIKHKVLSTISGVCIALLMLMTIITISLIAALIISLAEEVSLSEEKAQIIHQIKWWISFKN